MKKVDTRDILFNQMKLPQLMAQALSKKLDKPYEEMLKYTQTVFENKIQKVEKEFYEIGKMGETQDVVIDNPQSVEDFLSDKKIIKG